MRIFILTISILTALAHIASADVIHFKNGGKIEGIISEETDRYVVVDIGIGSMTIWLDEIERIEKATPEDIERIKKERLGLEIERGEWVEKSRVGLSPT